jgi:ribosomal protein S4E
MAAISKFIQGEGTEMKIARVRKKQYDDKGNVFFLMEPGEAEQFISEHANTGEPSSDAGPC